MGKKTKYLLIPLAILIGIPCLLLVALFLCVIVSINYPFVLLRHFRWKNKLRQQSRLISPELILRNEIPGTLIVDAPAFGWGTRSCWWTQEDLRAIAPMPIVGQRERSKRIREAEGNDLTTDEFNIWCWAQYLNDDTGRAKLLKASGGDDLADKLIAQRPELIVVETWSAMVTHPQPPPALRHSE